MAFTIGSACSPDREQILNLYACTGRPPRAHLDLSEYFVARVEAKVVGCAGIHRFDSGGYFFGLTVDREYRRQGIGAALTRTAVDGVHSSGGEFVIALAMFWNVRFFQNLGFHLTPRRDLPKVIQQLADFQDPTYRRSSVLFQDPGA
jgi:amino-acid N-acetyltransferase